MMNGISGLRLINKVINHHMKHIKIAIILFIFILSIFWMSYDFVEEKGSYSSNFFDSSFINHNKWNSGKAEIVVYEINKETAVDFKGEVSIMKTKDTLFMSLTKHLVDLKH